MANVMTLTTPLMRQTVGFDRFNDLFERLISDANEGFDNYPPYNIEKLGDDYKITMAVAGFQMDDLEIILQNGELTVSGRVKAKEKTDDDVQILHRGIATRSFQRTFRLADYIQVKGAEIKDGLLMVHLVREIPEEKKPRMIPIIAGEKNNQKTIENKNAKN